MKWDILVKRLKVDCERKGVQVMKSRQQRKTATVSSIQTEYVQSLQKKEQRKQARKVRLYRRLTVFAVIVMLSLGLLTHTLYKQKQVLAAKEQEKVEMLAKLEEVKKEQKQLRVQLEKLNDDEYIAKLARKEYFLSDQNEIIFSTPSNKKKNEEKTGGKE